MTTPAHAALLSALDARATTLDRLRDTVVCADWRDLLAQLPAQSVDMCLTDSPYGTTACSWDTVIDLDAWWAEMRRVMKPRGAVVMTASQPYTSVLVCSNLAWFRYCWYYEKSRGKNFQQVQFRPLMVIEDIVVFSPSIATFSINAKTMYFYPQKIKLETPYTRTFENNLSKTAGPTAHIWNKTPIPEKTYTHAHPRNLLYGHTDADETLHPTQKPVALFDYLIRTYTRPGDLVLDPFVGSGTTALAARNIGRHYIVGDNGTDDRTGKTWADVTRARLEQPWQPRLLDIEASTA